MFLEIKDKPCFPLKLGQLYLLGKQIIADKALTNNFIELEDEEDVIQRHCVIELNHREEAFVFDLFSLKGTLLNNKELNGMEKTRLNHGDILKLGKTEIKFVHEAAERYNDSSQKKNSSSFIASSPNTSSHLETGANFLVPSIPPKILNASSSAFSLSNRRSDSFIIPETQYCAQRNSLNGSNLSVAESIPDVISGKINFSLGNLNSSADDDDFCIPETQEVLQAAVLSKKGESNLLANVQNSANENNISGDEPLKLGTDGSQFRICTQDYNEGFGEEESAAHLHSQIIPLIKHHTVNLDFSYHSNVNSVNQSHEGQQEKELSAVKLSNSKTIQARADCATPDIFDFDGVYDVIKNQECTKAIEDVDKSKVQADSLGDGDEEDFLPTQALPGSSVKTILENSCLEKENEEIISLSDKENRCPVTLETVADLPATQLFEVLAGKSQNSVSCRKSINSAIKPNTENTNSSVTTEIDEEDFVLTQAVSSSSSAFSKNSTSKCLNSTLLDEKLKTQNVATFFTGAEETPLKPSSSSEIVFKKPEKEFSVLKKFSSGLSTTCENDLDLLMCTPQLIKDNMCLGKSEDLKKNILAAKNVELFGVETEDEDDDDDKNDLVKLINIPKDSLDFDKLLPHLNRNHESNKMDEEEKSSKEAQKVYKFNISFGKQQDEKVSKSSNSKSSVLSRDERHAARDKEKQTSERKGRTKVRDEKFKTDKNRVKQMDSKEKNENKDNSSNKLRKNETQPPKAPENVEETTNKKQSTSKQGNSGKGANTQKKPTQSSTTSENVSENSTNKSVTNTRLRKRRASSDKTNEKDPEAHATPAKRVTRSKSKLLDTPPTDIGDDMDSIPTQPAVRITRNRTKSEQNESQDSHASTSSSRKNSSQRKRAKTEDKSNTTKVEIKRLRSSQSSTSPVSICMTMVDQGLFQKLFSNSKGLWNIATNCADCDVLVMDKAFRTFKFLLAMARGIPIVTSEYLKKVNESKSAKDVHINDYLFADPEFEKKYNFSLLKSQQTARNNKVFKGYEFLMTASILPNPKEIKAIIEASGGCAYEKTPPQPKENQKLYLVTAKADKKDWHKYRRLNKNIIFVSTEAIMSTVMSQSCEPMAKFIF